MGGVCSSEVKRNDKSIPRENARAEILEFFEWYAKRVKWDLLIIEDYAPNAKGEQGFIACEVGGIIRACFTRAGTPIIEVPIPTWKAVTGIKLKKTSVQEKQEYLNACAELFGFSFDTPDECDAFYCFWTVVQASRGNIAKLGPSVRSRLEELKIKL
jgi:hypothetical protein